MDPQLSMLSLTGSLGGSGRGMSGLGSPYVGGRYCPHGGSLGTGSEGMVVDEDVEKREVFWYVFVCLFVLVWLCCCGCVRMAVVVNVVWWLMWW